MLNSVTGVIVGKHIFLSLFDPSERIVWYFSNEVTGLISAEVSFLFPSKQPDLTSPSSLNVKERPGGHWGDLNRQHKLEPWKVAIL